MLCIGVFSFGGNRMSFGMDVVVVSVAALVAFALGRFLKLRILNSKIYQAEQDSEKTLENARVEAERIKKAKILEAKDQFYRLKKESEKEMRHKRNELARLDKKISVKEVNMDRRADLLANREQEINEVQNALSDQKRELGEKSQKLQDLIKEEVDRLESISGLTKEEAKSKLTENLLEEAKKDVGILMKKMRDDARLQATKEAKELIIQAIQRVPTSKAIESTVSIVRLPNDDMKGRIIGREGRNIRSFEMETGVEVVVDDTPEIVLLSCFDPIRREIAKMSLQKLISDGRIHPGRIEDVVDKARMEIEEKILEAGEQAVLDVGVHGIALELVKAIGRLNFLTTYGQNLMQHSMEVANIATIMACELGLDQSMAKRAGLLHDIGKSVNAYSEGTYPELGYDLAKKNGEGAIILNTIQSFDGKAQPESPVAVLVHAADRISINRPGARRENLEEYIRRLDKLETLTKSFPGVQSAYAIQAGKEIRVIVNPEELDDIKANQLTTEITRRIKNELKFPGQIKVSVVREYRAVSLAK